MNKRPAPTLLLKDCFFSDFETAVHVEGEVNVEVESSHFANGVTGLRMRQGRVSSTESTFENVETPFHLTNMGDVKITGTRVLNGSNLENPNRRPFNPKTPPLPVYCPKCQKVSASENYFLSGQAVTLWDNLEPCPNCAFPNAFLSEGTFSLLKEAAEIVAASDITIRMLQTLAGIHNDFASGRLSEAEAIVQASTVRQPIADFFNKWQATFAVASFVVTAVLTAATVACSYGQFLESKKDSANDELQNKVLQGLLRQIDRLEARQPVTHQMDARNDERASDQTAGETDSKDCTAKCISPSVANRAAHGKSISKRAERRRRGKKRK